MMRKLLPLFLIMFCTSARAQVPKTSALNPMDFHEKVLKFYPNPAVSSINFEFQKTINKDYTLQVYNFVGKKVYEVTAVGQKTNISLTDFYRGVYIFQLRDKSGRIIESGKFQVAK
ncbi:T9SS type A sorting domain-containing protein [Segetibacter sp. 3557_3]|nr:T9SS type A sorting domain-containing protein [Segetibacter sp. 3557_3]